MMRKSYSTAKKTIAAISAAACLTGLAACGEDSKTDANGKPIVTVQIIKRSPMIAISKMKYAKDLEKACDCTIQWREASENAWSQQKTASLAASEVADLTIWGYSNQDLAKYPLFEDLSDDLDKMPNVQEYFKESEASRRFATDLNGHIWQIPSNAGNSPAALAGGQFMRINKTWLDKLGLEVPRTWDELTAVLKAFKTQDPNGNGEADEIPFSPHALGTTGFGWYDSFLLLNSTGITTQFFSTGTQGLYSKDGKVGNFMQTDNFRRVIEYYHSLVEQGLVPQNAMTKDDSTWSGEVGGDTARVGVSFGWEVSDFGKNIDQYITMRVPKESASTPDSDVTWEAPVADVYNGAAVSANAKNKDAAFKIINAMLDPDLTIEGYYGDMGTYVTKEGENKYSVPEKTFADTSVTYGLADRTLAWMRPDFTVGGPGMASSERAIKAAEVYAPDQKNIGEGDTIPQWVTPSSDDQTTISNINTPLFSYAMPVIAKWISQGGLDDASWNEFQKNLKTLQIDDVVKIYQKWVDTYAKQN
ncbi:MULTISPECIES: extracellular solute-binding protein [Bifidobacterium]|nr:MULTISPECIES: extracellular solute-binding protein [Bifidobacterium]